MKITKFFLSVGFLFTVGLSGCATPLKTSEIQSKIEPGSSRADTLIALGIPDRRQFPADNREVFFYHDTGVYFVEDKLVHVFNINEQPTVGLDEVENQLKAKWAEIPDTRNQLAFKTEKGPVNAYRAFYYLEDETNFREAIRHRVNPEGHSTDLNGLCLAMRAGFIDATRELLLINVRTEAMISDHRAGRSVLRVQECLQFQENKNKVRQIQQLLNEHAEKLKNKPKDEAAPEEESKSVIDWDAVKDWLKPQVPETKK